MNKLVSLALASAAVLAAPAAFPCGAPFGPGMNVDPNQDILITHKADTETYVFKPTFCGDAKDFGVILPVPSMLAAEPALADEKVFAAVEELSKPKIESKTECRSRAPDFSDAGVGSGGGGGTTVVSSGTVGFLDWVQLEAKDEASFTSWLDANGYPYDEKAKASFAHYVEKKWFFVAFKVSQGAIPAGEKPCKSLGPIKLAFKTATPVVPTRMGAAGTPVKTGGYPYGFSWRVFAITDATQQVDFASTGMHKFGFAGAIPSTDLGKLGGLAAEGDRLSKLTIWFDGTETGDVALKLAPKNDYRETITNITYVDCGEDAAPLPNDGDVVTEDAGPGNSADAAGGGGGCNTSGRAGSTFFGLGVAALGLAVLRRRR